MLIASFALFVFLMCSAGHKPGEEKCVLIRQDKVPFDLYTVLFDRAGRYLGRVAFRCVLQYHGRPVHRHRLFDSFYSILVYAFCMMRWPRA